MSRERTYEDEQGAVRVVEGGSSAVARWSMHRSFQWEAHKHETHQLIWATLGSVQVETEELDWAVPPTMGLWIPGGVVHSVGGADPAQMFVLYFTRDACPIEWPTTTPVAVRPLARELIVHLSEPELSDGERSRAESVLFDCLAPVSMSTLQIPMPSDARARAVAEAILADPADQRDLAHWAQAAGAGVRTLTRIFSDETQMSFSQWRLLVRVRAAMQLLAAGTSVNTTARRVGYRSSSAFVQAFSRMTGTTPAAYAAAKGQAGAGTES